MRLDLAVSQKFQSLTAAPPAKRCARGVWTLPGKPCDEPGQEVPPGAELRFHAGPAPAAPRENEAPRAVRRRRCPDRRQASRAAHRSDRGAREGHALEPGPALPPASLRRPAARRGSSIVSTRTRPGARVRAQPRGAPRAAGPVSHARDRPGVRCPRRGRSCDSARSTRTSFANRVCADPSPARDKRVAAPSPRYKTVERLGDAGPRLDPPRDRAHAPDPCALLRGGAPGPRRSSLRKAGH